MNICNTHAQKTAQQQTTLAKHQRQERGMFWTKLELDLPESIQSQISFKTTEMILNHY